MEYVLDKGKPHLFIVTRMFSGLFESIQREEWNPSGIPAIVNLVERISNRWEITWIVSCKNETESSIAQGKPKQIVLNNTEMHFVKFPNIIKSGKANATLNDILTINRCCRLSLNERKKIFYFDRSNIVSAAFAKLFLRTPVVVRILGVYPDQKALAASFLKKLFNLLTFLAYRVKYDLAICSQDGSGGEYYIDKLLSVQTPKRILLNGVNEFARHYRNIKQNRISLLFVGKLIEDKGILELIESVTALKRMGKEFHLKIVGKGVLSKRIFDTIIDRNLQDYVEMAGSVEQRKLCQYYAETDVYISLNKLGNLSNTVLEAMSAGKCVVMLKKDNDTHTDEYTEKMIPEDTVIRVDRRDIVADLTEKLGILCDSPEEINNCSERMRMFADNFLWSWGERITYEIELLRKIVEGKSIPG